MAMGITSLNCFRISWGANTRLAICEITSIQSRSPKIVYIWYGYVYNLADLIYMYWRANIWSGYVTSFIENYTYISLVGCVLGSETEYGGYYRNGSCDDGNDYQNS